MCVAPFSSCCAYDMCWYSYGDFIPSALALISLKLEESLYRFIIHESASQKDRRATTITENNIKHPYTHKKWYNSTDEYLFIGWYLVVNLISCVYLSAGICNHILCYVGWVVPYICSILYYTMWIHAWDRIGSAVGWTKCVKADLKCAYIFLYTDIFHFQSKCVKWKRNSIRYMSIHTRAHTRHTNKCYHFGCEFCAFLVKKKKHTMNSKLKQNFYYLHL